jgi:hypothetical protein
MSADTTAGQVEAVLDVLDRELDGKNVESIEVRLAGSKAATLICGGDLNGRAQLALDLVAAQQDGEVLGYERVVSSYVDVRMDTTDFDHVVAAADRFGAVGDPDSVSVVAGRWRITRDRSDDDPTLTEARIRFVQRVDDLFALTGAAVSGQSLELWIDRKHRDALRAFLAEDPEAEGLGTIVVRIG